MSKQVFQKCWISPLTAVAFIAVAFTGTCLLFEVRLPFLKAIHEWMGLILVLVGILHLICNWKTLLAHFRRRTAFVAAGVGVVLCLLLAFAGGHEGGFGDEDGARYRHGAPGGPAGDFADDGEFDPD